ncbi:MAG: hypothetical protein AAF934_01625, partial [Bacteroidota bacterium]
DPKDKEKEKKKLKKLGASSFFDKETAPKVEKTIEELLEELDRKLEESRKTIEEQEKLILAMYSYEELLMLARATRLHFGKHLDI